MNPFLTGQRQFFEHLLLSLRLRLARRPNELMPKKIAIDLQYETSRTFWSDLQLLLEMVLLILGRSYRVDRDFCVLYAEKNTSGN